MTAFLNFDDAEEVVVIDRKENHNLTRSMLKVFKPSRTGEMTPQVNGRVAGRPMNVFSVDTERRKLHSTLVAVNGYLIEAEVI